MYDDGRPNQMSQAFSIRGNSFNRLSINVDCSVSSPVQEPYTARLTTTISNNFPSRGTSIRDKRSTGTNTSSGLESRGNLPRARGAMCNNLHATPSMARGNTGIQPAGMNAQQAKPASAKKQLASASCTIFLTNQPPANNGNRQQRPGLTGREARNSNNCVSRPNISEARQNFSMNFLSPSAWSNRVGAMRQHFNRGMTSSTVPAPSAGRESSSDVKVNGVPKMNWTSKFASSLAQSTNAIKRVSNMAYMLTTRKMFQLKGISEKVKNKPAGSRPLAIGYEGKWRIKFQGRFHQMI